MARPPMAAMVSSTQPASFRVSVCSEICTSYLSATFKAWLMAAGVAPQSSWTLRPMAPASTCSASGASEEQLPLPVKPRFIG